jgi:CHAT domain-containing protein
MDPRVADAASQVYQRIFGDALDRLPVHIQRLVVVPDDPLFQVPFDALRPTPSAPPLAQRFAIALAPSATTWWRLRQTATPHATSAALVYADPQGRSAWPTVAPGGGSSATRADGSLEPLPGARREGAGAERALPGPVRLRTGIDATETAFKRERITDYRILHFAAHAVLDAARPERTAVLLAPSDEDDGMLQVREIVDLRLDGQAVVLSACQSANGLLVPAEGLFGLSHAFVLAGARVVVANLWPVRDRDAADFVELMYDGIADGLPIRDAVHRARLASIARGLPVSAWAGMVVLGDGDVVLAGGRSWTSWFRWYHAVAAALVAVSLLAWRRAAHPRTFAPVGSSPA